jgi:hypothetical protein
VSDERFVFEVLDVLMSARLQLQDRVGQLRELARGVDGVLRVSTVQHPDRVVRSCGR